MKALLEQHGLVAALLELPASTKVAYDNVIQEKAYGALILCLGDRKLYTCHMHPGKSQSEYIDEFHKLVGRDALKLEDVLMTLHSRELQKMAEVKGDGGEGLYVRGRSSQRDMCNIQEFSEF
ncbi:hypothetical protein Tco_0405561 [Tanacetum coccineum]